MGFGSYDAADWDNREGVARRRRDTQDYQRGRLEEQQEFEEDFRDYDGRQLYYRSRPSTDRQGPGSRQGERGEPGGRSGARNQGGNRMADQNWERNQGRSGQPGNQDDWARQVRQQWQHGAYEDYGWERGESVLPEFRDPSVHRTPYDQEEEQRNRYGGQGGRQGPDFRRAYDYQNMRNMPGGEMPTERGYGAGYAREDFWKVPGPYVGRGPRGYHRSDERIREDVCERLSQHGQVDASDMEVRVSDGEVTLTGMADSRLTKRMAEDVAESVTGVRDVHNQLHVRNPQDQGMRSQAGQGMTSPGGQQGQPPVGATTSQQGQFSSGQQSQQPMGSQGQPSGGQGQSTSGQQGQQGNR